MRKLSDSFLFKYLRTDKFVNDLMDFDATERDLIPMLKFPEASAIFNLRYKYPGKEKIMKLWEKGDIAILVTEDGNKFPKTLPAWALDDPYQKKIIGIANATHYIAEDKRNGGMLYDKKKLYYMLQCATIARTLIPQQNRILTKSEFIKATTATYANMMYRAVDKILGIRFNIPLSEKILYLFGKYFYISILGRAPDQFATNVAMQTLRQSDKSSMEIFESETEIDFTIPMDRFVRVISSELGLKIDVSTLLRNWVDLYGLPLSYGFDTLGYFLMGIFSIPINAQVAKEAPILLLAEEHVFQAHRSYFNSIV